MDNMSFTVLSVQPIIKREGSEQPSRPEHCTRGHGWDLGFHFVGIALDLKDITEGREEFCFFCLRDWLREKCGRVKEGS